MPKKTIDQIDVASSRVLMRVDFNVPLSSSGSITDDSRIKAALPSINSVVDRGGKLILMSHLGRPDGNGYEANFSLKPAAERLAELLPGRNVTIPDTDCTSDATLSAVESMSDGEIVVLENLRFHSGEIANEDSFAVTLARYGDNFCNDAFGTAHRDHASMVGVPKAMEGKPCVAGLLLVKELQYFGAALENPEKPFVAVLGGAKVSDKLGVISNLMNRVDTILVGGAMAYTFCAALGQSIGASMAQFGMVDDAKKIIDEAAASPTDLILPTDHVSGREVTKHTPIQVSTGKIENGWIGLDIGPETAGSYSTIIENARTIVWNGPVGVAETPPFDVGSRQIALAMANATTKGATTIIGGGDTAAAIEAFDMKDKFSHISTGGGASLELLEGRKFTSVSLLDDA